MFRGKLKKIMMDEVLRNNYVIGKVSLDFEEFHNYCIEQDFSSFGP